MKIFYRGHFLRFDKAVLLYYFSSMVMNSGNEGLCNTYSISIR